MFTGAAVQVVRWCVSSLGSHGGRATLAGWFCALAALCCVGTSTAHAAPSLSPSMGTSLALAQAAGQQSPGAEVPSLRTATSRSYRLDDGSLVARVWGTPVNFRDGRGTWQPIDNRLDAVGAVLRNRSNRHVAEIPRSLDSGAFRLSDGRSWVSMRPLEATGSARVSGHAASFADAWPGVDATYEVIGDAIKETLVMADVAAVRTFRFSVDASGGLSARVTRAGVVELRDARGAVAWSMSAPVMVDAADASGRVQVGLARRGSGWELSLSPDRAWLAEPRRAWPVLIDPGVSPGSTADCTVSNATGLANNSFCANSYLEAGWGYSTGTHDTRALLKFDVQSAIPAGADVLDAQLYMHLSGQEGTQSKQIFARRVTQAWTSGVSWNFRDGVNAWTTSGGDFATAASDPVQTLNWATSPGFQKWSVHDMVDGWSTGRYANHGLLLADDGSHSTLGTMKFTSSEGTPAYAPFLVVSYNRRTGDRRGYAMERFKLSDRITLGVNPASGNLLVQQRDLTIPGGTGPDVTFSRAYNSLREAPGAFSNNWTWDLGQDRFLTANQDFDEIIQGPTGTEVRFARKPDGSYTTPPGYDQTLVNNGNGTYTLTEHKSQQKTVFGSNRRVTRIEDRNGRSISFTYDHSARTTSITDSQGRQTTVEHTDPDLFAEITKITDPAGRQYLYGYTFVNGQKLLTSYTDPEGGTTAYAYNNAHQLTKVTTPGGRQTNIVYYASGAYTGRVHTITRVTNNVAQTGPVTEFAYQAVARDGTSKATVTDPRNHNTNYEFDAAGRPTKVTDALSRNASTGYTSNYNVEKYTAPFNTGSTPNTTLSYDADGNNTGSTTITTGAASGNLTAVNVFGATGPQGPVAGAAYLPAFIRNTQDTPDTSNNRGTRITYDAKGNPLTIVKYNSANTAISTVSMAYENGGDGKPGQLASSTDPNSNTTNYDYDSTGNLTTIVPPLVSGPGSTPLGNTVLTYNGGAGDDQALSRITRATDGRGFRAYYEYDDLDRVQKLSYKTSADVEQFRFEYDYDADGNLTERRDIAGLTIKTYTFTHDLMGRLTQEARPGGGTTTYTYDAASNLATLVDGGGTVSYGYDAINRQTSVQEPGAASPITFAYEDTAFGGLKVTKTLPNGVVNVQEFDPAGRTKSTKATKTATTLQEFVYDYTVGTKQQRLVSSETDKDLNKTTYSYDQLDRLAYSARYDASNTFDPSRFVDYTYDAATNITAKTQPAGTITRYRYNQANQLCWALVWANPSDSCQTNPVPAGATTFSYDANGNRTSPGSGSYNAANQLTSFAGTAFAFEGPGQDRRTSIGSTAVVNNALGVSSHGSTYFTRGEAGSFESQRATGAAAPNRRIYPLTDQLGSTRTLTDENGTVVRRYEYDPYGNDVAVTGTWSASTPLRFAGGELDPTGLYHYGQRYYDPATMRWTQQDALRQPADLTQANRYMYVSGDPVNLVDPAGTKNLTASCSAGVGGASVTQDTTGRRKRQTRFGGVSLGAGYPGCSAIAYRGEADEPGSFTATACGGVCLSYDSDKGLGFGLGVGIGVSIGGGGN